MFNRFIVATDLSSASYAVAGCLSGLKTYGATECLLLLCTSLEEAASAGFAYTTSPLDDTIAEQKKILEQQGFIVEARIVPGFAKAEINHIAVHENYPLIVIGTQGHSLIGEALLGGVAYGVIQSARKPVLLIPVEKKLNIVKICDPAAGCNFSEHILFPTDFSVNADYAFTYLEKLVAYGARSVTLLHVQDKSKIEKHLEHRLKEFNEIDTERLNRLKDLLQQKGDVQVNIELRYGNPFLEIIKMTRERGVHLVIMGSQGRGFIKELFLGSVSHNVVRHSETPVLLVPTRER